MSRPPPFSARSCYRCGGTADRCQFKDGECRKKGHIAKVCRAKQRSRKTENTLQVTIEEQTVTIEPTTVEDVYGIFALKDQSKTNSKVPPLNVAMLVSRANLVMEVDAGASTSIISETMYRNTWSTASSIAPNYYLTLYIHKGVH